MNRELSARHPLLIGLVAVVVLFTNLGGPRLWDRDEPRNAGCAREMLARGDWVTPVFNGELRNHKPVLLYWLMMSAYSVFGVTEFAARFWSAALGTGSVLLTYAIGKHLFGARAAVWSAIALCTSLMFNVAARAATPDSSLIFFTTLGVYFYARGALPKANSWTPDSGTARRDHFPRSFAHAALIYGSFAIGVLAKGPVAIVLPTAVIGLYLLISQRSQRLSLPSNILIQAPMHFLWTSWRMRPFAAILMLLVVAAPWYAWVGLRTDGQFLWEFFVEHNLNRARQPMEGHDGPLFYYWVALLPGFFPWSIFLVPTFWQAFVTLRRKEPGAAAVMFCLCWLGVWIGLFSLASTKLPSYITPCYPALALLTGLFVDRWIQAETVVPAIWPKIAIAVLAVAGVAMLIALPIVASHYLPAEEWLAVVGLIPLAGAVAAATLLHRGQRRHAAASMAASAALLSVALFAVVAQRVDRHQQSDKLLAVVAGRGSQAQLGAFGVLEPSWVFYAERNVHELSNHGSHEQTGVVDFLAKGNDHYVITTRRHLVNIADQLPATVTVLKEAPYFLKDEQLVLLGHSNHVRTAKRGGASY